MGKFGFGDDGGDEIKLPPPKKTSKGSKKAAKTEVENAVRAGEQLGFVNRTQPRRRKPEPQDKLLVTGPKSVIDRYREYCDETSASSYWRALDELLKMADR